MPFYYAFSRVRSSILGSAQIPTEPDTVLPMNGEVCGMKICPHKDLLYMNIREHVTKGITAKKFYQKQNSTEIQTDDCTSESDSPFSYDSDDDNWNPWGDDDDFL